MNVQHPIPDPRSRTDRRQRDGLGLLPRARTAEERERRRQANLMIAGWLIVLGTAAAASGLRQLIQTPDFSAWMLLLLGGVVLAQGVLLVGRKERRKADRRKGR